MAVTPRMFTLALTRESGGPWLTLHTTPWTTTSHGHLPLLGEPPLGCQPSDMCAADSFTHSVTITVSFQKVGATGRAPAGLTPAAPLRLARGLAHGLMKAQG